MPKYNRGKYGQIIYGVFFGQSSYTETPLFNTGWTEQPSVTSNWGEFGDRHTYGAEFGTSTRVRYGDHVLFASNKIPYKFKNTNFSTDR
jgi:hypothetical protein